MRSFTIVLTIMIMLLGVSCAKVAEDITAPAEPTATDELAPRVEPKRDDDRYNPLIEEELESDEAPLETQEMEDQPLIK